MPDGWSNGWKPRIVDGYECTSTRGLLLFNFDHMWSSDGWQSFAATRSSGLNDASRNPVIIKAHSRPAEE